MLRFLPRHSRLAAFHQPPSPVAKAVAAPCNLLITRSFSTSNHFMKVWSSRVGLPKEARTMDRFILEALDSHAAASPNQKAIISASNPAMAMDFVQMQKSIHSMEVFLHNIEFKKGDVATVLLPNCVEYPVILAGVLARGGVASTASPVLTEYEMKWLLRDNESKIVFTADVFLKQVVAAAKMCKNVQTIVAVRMSEMPLPAGITPWKTVMDARGLAPKIRISPNDLAVLPYSSGTTGIPKGVMLTHRNLVAAVNGVRTHFEKEVLPKVFPGISEEGVREKMANPLVLFLPFYHIYGLGFLFMKLFCGATIVQLPKFEPVVFLAALQKYKPWELPLVPPVALFLAKRPEVAKFDLSSVKWIVSGAAPLPEEIGLELKERLPGVSVVQGYGLTETGALTTLPISLHNDSLTSVGVPGPGMQLKIVDKDGKELGTNEKGEIAVAGKNVMMGYHKNNEETKKTLRHGWLHTGDIGYVNEKDQLYIVDRIKELIKVKGLQVAPAQLEAVLAKNHRIADAAVIGVPHPELGEAPRAFVVKADSSLTEDDVKKAISDRLTRHNWLEGGVCFVKEIPKSPAGKILRRLLNHPKTLGE